MQPVVEISRAKRVRCFIIERIDTSSLIVVSGEVYRDDL